MRVKIILTFAILILLGAGGFFLYQFGPKLYSAYLLKTAGVEASGQNLVQATCRDDVGTVLLMLEAGVNVNVKATLSEQGDTAERTPLYCAAGTGDTGLANLLIQHGASLDTPSQDGETPIFAAVRPGSIPYAKPGSNLAMLDYLLAKGANINAKSVNGTVLHLACRIGNVKLLNYLLDHHANPAIADSRGVPPIGACAANSYIADQIPFDRLLVKGVNLNAPGSDGLTLLSRAVESNNLALVNKLISLGANVSAADTDGDTPLIHAVRNKQLLTLLISKGADINHPGQNGTALNAALNMQQMDTVAYLLSKGANPTVADMKGNTPLHYAARTAHDTAAIPMLIAAGARVNAVNQDGDTPLHIAIRYGNEPGAKALIGHGAKVNIKNYANQTPLDLARTAGAPPAPPDLGGDNTPPPIVNGQQSNGNVSNQLEKLLKHHGAR